MQHGAASALPWPGDQPGATMPGDVGPGPLEQHQEAVAEADQERDVDEKPGEPRDEPGQLEPAHDRDGRRAPDGRHAALVAVAELAGRAAAPPSPPGVRPRASPLGGPRGPARPRRAPVVPES